MGALGGALTRFGAEYDGKATAPRGIQHFIAQGPLLPYTAALLNLTGGKLRCARVLRLAQHLTWCDQAAWGGWHLRHMTATGAAPAAAHAGPAAHPAS